MRASQVAGRSAWALLAGVMLAGCTLLEDDAREPITAPEILRTDVQGRMAEVGQDTQAALALWDRVVLGEPVSCIEMLVVPRPLLLAERDRMAYPQVVPILAELNAAIQALQNASDLWNIECADERAFVPLAMAREGRAAAVSADEALAAARALFDAWALEPTE